jgi:Mrp family chromosome partitioning ATPase/capsular polysaccharide biosynthesis protein
VDQPRTDLRERLSGLSRQRLLIAAAVVATTLGAVLYSSRGASAYSASSQVMVRPVLVEGTLTPQDVSDAVQDPLALSAPIDTQVRLVTGEDVQRQAASLLPADVAEDFSIQSSAVTDEVLEIEASAPNADTAVAASNAYANAFLESRRTLVRDAFAAAVSDLDRQMATLTARSNDITDSIASASSEDEAARLRAQQSSISATLTDLVTTRDQRAAQRESVTGGGQIVQTATSASASGPVLLRDALVGVILGLALGLGLALLRSSTDRRVLSLDAAADATNADVLAAIPKRSLLKSDGRAGVRVQVFANRGGPKSADRSSRGDEIAELKMPPAVTSSFSMLREALVVRGLGKEFRRVVLLSPEPGEGSDLAASGMAWACAQAGLRTVAIDGALGLGERAPLFGTRGSDGLGQVLTGKATLTEAVLSTSVAQLRFLPAGTPRHRADDELASARPSSALDALAKRVDVVLIRSPALSSGGDAMAWASDADAILLVLGAGVSRPGAAGRASRSLRSLGLPLLGVVLTSANARDGSVGLSERGSMLQTGWRPETDGHPAAANGYEVSGQQQAHVTNPMRGSAVRGRRR